MRHSPFLFAEKHIERDQQQCEKMINVESQSIHVYNPANEANGLTAG